MKQQAQKQVQKHIRSDAVIKDINPEKQNRHIRDSDGYIPGRSYLFKDIDAQKLVDKYYGTGEVSLTLTNDWKNNEVVTADRDIGIRIDPKTGKETVTNRFTIHYSRTGTHIVPAKRRQ